MYQDDLAHSDIMEKIRLQIGLYGPQRSCGKVMFLHLSLILFTGGGCLPQCILGYTPWADTPGQTPPWADTPLGRPPGQICWGTVNKRAVRILLECILVSNRIGKISTD